MLRDAVVSVAVSGCVCVFSAEAALPFIYIQSYFCQISQCGRTNTSRCGVKFIGRKLPLTEFASVSKQSNIYAQRVLQTQT